MTIFQDVRIIMVQNGYDPPTADLMQHCVEMFYAAASSKLSHPRFVPSDTEEVCSFPFYPCLVPVLYSYTVCLFCIILITLFS